MSVLVNVNATPNRVEIVYRYLLSRPGAGEAEDILRAELTPPALAGRRGDGAVETQAEDAAGGGSSAITSSVLIEARKLGVIETGEADQVRVPAPLRAAGDGLLAHLEAVLLDPAQAGPAGQEDFARALSWLLEQDPAEPINFGENLRPRVEDEFGPEVNAFGLTNYSRLQNLYYWARYLGYAWRLETPGNPAAVLPDPSDALARHLPEFFAERDELPIRDLVRAWAGPCPVLESGAARGEILERQRAERRRSDTHLSISTSLALTRLERRGLIQLVQPKLRSDAPTYLLSTWPDSMSVSHVKWRRTEARGR